MAYQDPLIKRTDEIRRGSGDAARAIADEVNQYLSGLSPTQLLERYRAIDESGADIASYQKQKYGAGNAMDQAFMAAYRAFKDQIGRDPSANEFAELSQLFYNPADFNSGISTGRSAIANFAENEAATRPVSGDVLSGKYGNLINQLYQSRIGRNARPEEIEHFGNLIDKNQLDAYGLDQVLQASPEFQTIQTRNLQTQQQTEDETALNQLNEYMKTTDLDFFNKAKEDVISKFAQQGTLGSSALDNALTNLMGDIAKQRSSYLGNLKYENYLSRKNLGTQGALGNQGFARDEYSNLLNQVLGKQGYAQQRGDMLSDLFLNRAWQGQDYATQRRDYQDALSQMTRANKWKPTTYDWINLGLQGGRTGAEMYSGFKMNPQAATAFMG